MLILHVKSVKNLAIACCQKLLWAFLKELSNRPLKMYVTKEMKHMLFPLGNLLGVEFIESELPMITQYKHL